jgi:two-component system phosphate regulon sensor histidine kinase PhoR
MTKKTITLIIVLTSISLLALIGTQLFWIRNAINLSEKHFDHRVTLALNDVIKDIETILKKDKKKKPDKEICTKSIPSVRDLVKKELLDSLLKKHFDYHCVDTNYVCDIIKCSETDKSFKENQGILSKDFSVRLHKACLSCIWERECFNLVVTFPNKLKFVLVDMSMWLVLSILFLLIVLFSFVYITRQIIRQKKLSEVKNDFINNMTHELKTPISTISMAAEVLLKSNSNSNPERVAKYSNIIFEENQRLTNQVERVLQMAVMDKGELKLTINEINMHQLIKEATNNLCLEHCEKPVSLNFNLNAEKHTLYVDILHMRNIITNLVDNAYKYSKENPEITISTINQNNHFIISVEDKGIGMGHETQKHIFDKFYRLPTGNLHDVKGFGIGLYYVKSMVELHSGTITVKSELNKGSKFFVYLPLT